MDESGTDRTQTENLRLAPEPARPRHVIKRYANRKLYDRVDRTFVTLREIGDLVRDEVDVVVVDHRTGREVTQEVLVQVIGALVSDDDELGDTTDILQALIRAPSEVLVALVAAEQRQAEIRDLRRHVETVSSTIDELIATMGGQEGEGRPGSGTGAGGDDPG